MKIDFQSHLMVFYTLSGEIQGSFLLEWSLCDEFRAFKNEERNVNQVFVNNHVTLNCPTLESDHSRVAKNRRGF